MAAQNSAAPVATGVKPLFRIVKDRTAWWPVQFDMASEDGGEVETVEIEMRFRLVGVDEAKPLMDEAEKLDDAADGNTMSARFARMVMSIATDWRGVGSENGQPMLWSADSVAALMNVPGVFDATMRAFRNCLTGRREVREKN